MGSSGTMMFFLPLFLAVILFSEQWLCLKIVECGSSYPRPYVNHESRYIQNINKTGPCEMLNTEMSVMDQGDAVVKFTVQSRNCTFYKLELRVNKSISEMDCSNMSKKHINSLHGEKSIYLVDQPCKGEVNVTFEDVPTGCYKLFYCTLQSISSEKCRNLVRYLNTNIQVKQETKVVQPYVTPDPKHDRHEVSITVSHYTTFNEIQMTLRLDNDTINCNSKIKDRLTVWLARDLSGSLMCKRRNGEICYKNEVFGHVEGKNVCNEIVCYEEQDSFYCVFKNIPPGNYCVNVVINDENPVFQSFELKEMNEPLTYRYPDSPVPVLYVGLGIAVAFILISFLALMLICRRRWSSPQQVVMVDDDNIWLQSPEILLLYPRDCKAFMNMMATCRQIMEERTGCKVYDCFDPHQSEDLSLNKVDWLRGHMLRSNMKVVVIETPCAALHQRALIQQSRVTYKEPTWLDDMFLFGLKFLTDNFDRNNYQRVFVVCVEGFTMENDSLNYLTPFTRYAIPRYLDLLIASLNVQNIQKNNIMRNTDDERFEHDLRNLINYRKQNPEYLQQLISIH